MLTGEPFQQAWQRQVDVYRDYLGQLSEYEKTLTPEFLGVNQVRWIVVSDGWLRRHGDQSDAVGVFVGDLTGGQLGYRLVHVASYRLPVVQPPTDFINPTIRIYAR